MRKVTRDLNQLKAELKEYKAQHLAKYGVRKWRLGFPILMGKNEVDSLAHIAFIEGLIRGIKDERGLT